MIALRRRDKVSLAGDGDVFVFGKLLSVDRALARTGTILEGQAVLKDVLRQSR